MEMEDLKQRTIDLSVENARKNMSSGAYVTPSDEAIAWMADQIDELKKPKQSRGALESVLPEIIDNLVGEFQRSSLTVDEYTLAVALGSMAKQMKAFGKNSELVAFIEFSLEQRDFKPSKVGSKLA